MTRTPWLRAIMLTLVTTLASGSALAAEAPRERTGREAWKQRFQQELGLTDDQMQALRQIRERDAATLKQHARSLHRTQIELRRQVLSGADPATVQATQTEVQRLLGEMVQMRVDTLRAVSPILTPEQREKYAQYAFGGWPRHQHRHGPPS